MEQREGYKKTAIGWIPEDWDVHKFGNLFEERKEINNIELPLLAVTNSDGIVLRDTLIKKDTSASDKSKYKTVYPYDIAYNTMRLWQGVSGLSTYKGIVSPAYTVLKPKEKVYSPFYQYLMKTERMINWFYRFSSGICSDTNNCKYQAFKKIPAVLPPLPEQTKIADILTTVDDKISSIDSQIQQTEQLKKGLMEKLLTEGIGHTEFKETEIGRIPKEWDVKKLGNFVEIFSGQSPSKFNFVSEGKNKFFKVNQLNFCSKYLFESEYSYDTNGYDNLQKGTVVFPKRGASIFTNKVRILGDDGFFDTNIMGLKPNHNLYNEYLYYFLIRFELSNIADTSSVPQINNKHINPIFLALPPLPEQKQIATILSTIDDKLDILNLKKSHCQTLKKGLSQKLLTGQVRVKV